MDKISPILSMDTRKSNTVLTIDNLERRSSRFTVTITSKTDVEACHKLPVSRSSSNIGKRIRVKSANHTNTDLILVKKFIFSSTDFTKLTISNKSYVNISLCPYYQFLWDRKELQHKNMIRNVFCLGSFMANKLFEQTLPLKISPRKKYPLLP